MVGGDKFLSIVQTGNIILDTSSAQFHLHDVMYIPIIKENLFSIAKFTKENFVSFEFFAWGMSSRTWKLKHFFLKAL